jgi:hypothetical protein
MTKYTPPRKNDNNPRFVNANTVTFVATFGFPLKFPRLRDRDIGFVLTLVGGFIGDIAPARDSSSSSSSSYAARSRESFHSPF